MMRRLFKNSQNFLTAPQSTILSAAMIIMFMNVVSLVLGLLRRRAILSFFDQSQYALFEAAFRLPDIIFEVFALGAFSSAFIPVFSKILKDNQKKAWEVAGKTVNIALLIFGVFAIVFGIFSHQFYEAILPNFSDQNVETVASLARVIFFAQGLFIVSYVVTGVLESLRRFLIPALAPLFYNLGIIITTVFFSSQFGLMAPAFGVVVGALLHLAIQIPFAFKFGFRIGGSITPDEEVRKIGKLALPRVFELGILQILKTSELFFASLISVPAYAYLTLAHTLQAAPISLFAVSLAKASLPTLSQQDNDKEFIKTFLKTLYQMMFLVIPISTLLIIFRIPIVRLLFGTRMFDWEATVQTGLVLTAYAIGIPFQAALTLLSRAFYARHDTKTPVTLAVFDVVVTLILEGVFIFYAGFSVWSLALANTIAGFITSIILFLLLSKKLNGGTLLSIIPIAKSALAAISSGSIMFFLLKFFDQSVWVKRLSFLSGVDEQTYLTFKGFVLDTRYTPNLIILTVMVSLVGMLVYVGVCFLLRSEELVVFVNVLKNRRFSVPVKESEPVTGVE